MTSLFSVIRAAVRPGTAIDALDLTEGEPGASALNPETPLAGASNIGVDMSEPQTGAGAAAAAAALTSAVAAAASGGGDGFKTAMDRMNAVLGADSIKGDARRMSAAFDLANASPDMAADAVVAFVAANVPATQAAIEPAPAAAAVSSPDAAAAAYEAQRLAAANLAMPGGSQAAGKETIRASWSDAIAKAGVGRKGA